MLTEDEVVLAVCDWLTADGWLIRSRALATERGDDVVAARGDTHFVIEAKGGGSSREGSRRYGKEFTLGQCHVNVGMAVLRALKVAAEGRDLAGVAFPDTPDHRRVVEPVLPALRRAPVRVLLVSPRAEVTSLE